MTGTAQHTHTNGVATYRTKPIKVQAIRWLGEPNCEQVFAFIGWTHPNDETDHTLIGGLGVDGEQEAEIGDWIVRDEDGVYEVFIDRAFHAEFEAADDAR